MQTRKGQNIEDESMQVIDNELVAVSKIVKPTIKVENPNKKLKVKWVNQPNKDET